MRRRRRSAHSSRTLALWVVVVGCAVLGTWSAVLPSGVSATQANLFQNPSLESATNQVPTCWQLGGYGSNSFSWARTTDAHSGLLGSSPTEGWLADRAWRRRG